MTINPVSTIAMTPLLAAADGRDLRRLSSALAALAPGEPLVQITQTQNDRNR